MITAEDVDEAVRFTIEAFEGTSAAAWEQRAGDLEWTCRETVEHIADCFFYYSAQLAQRTPPTSVPAFRREARREGGPESMIGAAPGGGTAALLQLVEVCGTVLSSVVRTARPSGLAFHLYGASDPEGFAAMGVLESLVHGKDVADGLGIEWRPSDALCERVARRLFPEMPAATPGWQALQWCTGRIALPGLPRRVEWRWDGTPR
ncbi:DinB family protein [Actinokineospora enzanensis]|uniref:DinB family protein n=1 Tax=Actinokineospora enzanensis TaxID=155975 RepID=UPI00037C6E3F|nr:hypothetical protein [Actinokineospora enzanensis]